MDQAVMFNNSILLFTLYFSNILLLILRTVFWLIFKCQAISLVLNPCRINTTSSRSLLESALRRADGLNSLILHSSFSCLNTSTFTPLNVRSAVISRNST
jgi:hypothetical protein